MANLVERCFVHTPDEFWEYDSIMLSDFPILKDNGFQFAIIFADKFGKCFVYGHYKRAYAVKQAKFSNGKVYNLKTNEHVFLIIMSWRYIMMFILEAENRNGNAFKMQFNNLHDVMVSIKAIEKANETLEKYYKFYGQVIQADNDVIKNKNENIIVIF